MFDFSEMDPFFDDEAANQNAKNCIELLICLIYVNMCVYVYTYIYIYIHICIPKPMHNIYIYIYMYPQAHAQSQDDRALRSAY